MPDVQAATTIKPWNDVRDLVQRCRAGDLHAFAALFEHFQGQLHDLAWVILQDEVKVEDAVQDTFLHLFGGRSVT